MVKKWWYNDSTLFYRKEERKRNLYTRWTSKFLFFWFRYLFPSMVNWTTLNRNEGKNNVSRNNMSLENLTDLREFNRAAKSWSVKNPHVTSNRVLFRWTISFYNTVRIFVVSEFRPRTFVLSLDCLEVMEWMVLSAFDKRLVKFNRDIPQPLLPLISLLISFK